MQAKKRTLKAPTQTGRIPRRDIRAAVKAVHIIPRGGEGWEVTKSGDGQLSQQFPNKREALEFAQSVGKQKNVELIIHGRDGQIQRIDSSQEDLLSPRDTAQAR